MVLSHLPIRDLTRSLSVSKQWNSTILGSRDLRRNLFLEPAPVKEYLEHKKWYKIKKGHYTEKRERQPVIIYEPSEHSQIIAEPHPVIASACNLESRADQDIRGLSLEDFKTVSPSTLLFQPPPKRISVCYGPEIVSRSPVMTFGAIVEGFEKARKSAEKMVLLFVERGFGHEETYSKMLDGTDDSISMVTWEALASNANCVKVARKAME
jgi:hypothetical protein